MYCMYRTHKNRSEPVSSEHDIRTCTLYAAVFDMYVHVHITFA